MQGTRQALRRVRTENAAKLRDFHDDGDGEMLVLATTNEITGRAREDDVSARTLLNAHRAKLADRIGFVFQLLIGVANTVCITTLLIVGVKGLGNRRNETNMDCLYYLGICFWYLQVIFARTSIIRTSMPEFTVRTRHIWGGTDFGDSKVTTSATRPDDEHHLHRPLPAMILHCALVVAHWLARELTPLLMAPVGPVVEPLMDWFVGIDPFLFNRSSPDTRSLRIPELTKALEDYEDREATRAADLRRPIPPCSPTKAATRPAAAASTSNAEDASDESSSESGDLFGMALPSRGENAAAADDDVRLPRCCFELFDGFRARAGVARAMSECTFLGGAHQGTVLRGFVILTIALIPIGLRCVGDDPAPAELACFASGVMYVALLIFSYCWREDPVHHAARFLTSLADGFSIFTMSLVGFAPQVSTAELPLGVWLLLQAALLATLLLFGIHLGIAWDNARWSSARRAPRQPLVQRQFTGPTRHLHAARSWAAVWLWRVPKYLCRWLVLSLFATVTVGMDRVSTFWSVDMAFRWYIGGTRYSRMVEGAVAGARTPEMKLAIAAAGKRVAEQSSPSLKEALTITSTRFAREWPILGYVGPYDKRLLWAYVGCQAPAALLPFAVVVASFFTADAAVVRRWPPLLRLVSMVSVIATLISVALLTHLSRRFWGFRGWVVRGDINYKKFLQELVALHRPPVSALLKHEAVHHSVLPADVVDDVVGPFVPSDELTDRLSLADCAQLGFGRPKQHA